MVRLKYNIYQEVCYLQAINCENTDTDHSYLNKIQFSEDGFESWHVADRIEERIIV